MADEVENDDQWLYGDTADLPKIDSKNDEEEKLSPEAEEEESRPEESEQPEEPMNNETTEEQNESNEPTEKEGNDEEDEQENGDASDKDDSEDDSDDDINVVIGDIKTSPSYTSLNIKRSGILASAGGVDKQKQVQPQSGKFTVEELEQAGNINGVPASEFNLDSLEEKPWRKPGADITDYFNYGFNEDTWRAYCERQKRLRINESGVGLAPMTAIGMPRGPVPIMNDNSKYSGNFIGVRKAGPPPGRRMTGSIDVIGGAQQRVGGATSKIEAPKENVIQVMTADRREYSRKPPGFPDMSMPPPTTFEDFSQDFSFNPEPDPYFGGYEPTQDSQWGPDGHPPWPQDIKPLTAGPIIPSATATPINMGPPNNSAAQPLPTSKESPPIRREGREEREREREVSRSRSEKSRDRERERSHRRERSRSRSRRHKSRSRSPSHRSHRKKKSRRHEDSD